MVSVFVGSGAGFARGSGNILGGAGLLGSGVQGRSGEIVSVNAATGNLLISRQDEFLVGRGPDASISRTYNSLAQVSDGDNNDQWQMSTVRRVFGLTGTLNATGSTISYQGSDGSVILYAWNAAKAAYVTTDGDGAHDMLVKSGATWVRTDGSTQDTETYEASAGDASIFRIKQQADTDGNKLGFAYVAGTDKLYRVTTQNHGTANADTGIAEQSYVEYSWSGNNITQIVTGYTDYGDRATEADNVNKTLTRTRYGYDSSNRLIQVTVDLSPEDNSVSDGKTYVTTYSYDGSSKRIASITQTDGSSLAIAYDSSGRVSTLTQMVATGDNRVTALTYGAGYTNVTGPDGQVTRLDYDGVNQLAKITAPPASAGAPPQTFEFGYDAAGNVTSVTDAAGKVTSHTYDANGNVLTSTDANGHVTTRTYGSKNELLTETRTGSDATGVAVDHTTRYVYGTTNRLRYVVGATGNVTEYRYSNGGVGYRIDYPEHGYPVGSGPLSEATMNAWRDGLADRSSTQMEVFARDSRGNLLHDISYGTATAAGAASTAEGYSRVYTSYDQEGRLLARYGQGENSETFVYDGLGRLVASTDLAGGTTTIVFNDPALTTTITTGTGYTSVNTYNKAGDLIGEAHSGSNDVSGSSSYLYDKNGRLRVATDATGNKTYYLYDKAGRKIADINHLGHITEYRYDAAGRVAASASYANAVAAGHLTTLGNPNNTLEIATIRPAAHADDIWAWSIYDNGGRLIERIDGDGGVAVFSYDASNRLVKTVDYANKLTAAQLAAFKAAAPTALVVPTANAAKDAVSRSFYDGDGRLIGALDGEGYLTEVVYDKAGQKVEEIAYAAITSSTHWAAGSFDQLRASAGPSSSANRRARYVYDGQGLLRYTVDNGGYVSSHAYNVAGKLTTTIVHAAQINTSDFSYDNVKALVAGIANSTTDRQSYSIYNAKGQVAYAVDNGGAVSAFTYDAEGRVTKAVRYAALRNSISLPSLATMDSWAAGQAGNAANRVTRSWYSAGGDLRYAVDGEGHVTRFDYDAEGRLTAEHRPPNAVTATDATTIAQMASLMTGAGTAVTVSYTYDSAGRRNSVYDGENNRTVYTWHATGLLASIYRAYDTADQSRTYYVYDGAGRLKTEYQAYGEAGVQTATHYAYDGLGNRTSVTDPRGKVTTYTYDERGQVLTVTDAAGGVTAHEYNGFGDVVKTTDPKGGITYHYYDALGRVTRTRDAESHVTDTSYTAFGQVASVKRWFNKTASAASTTVLPTVTAHAQDATTVFEYDKRGLVAKTTDAEGWFESYTYNAFGNRTGVTAKSKDENRVAGGTTTYAYDRRGLLVSETLPVASFNAAGTQVAASVTNTFGYDARGNRIQMVEAAGLAEARTTSYEYDKADRLKKTTGQTFLGKSPQSHIRYDARGNVTSTVDPAGAVTVYYYDDLDRVVVSISAVGTYTLNSYDANGNLTAVRVYNTAVTVPADGGAAAAKPAAPSGTWRETSFAYDNLNRLTGSSITGITTGAFNGTSWVSATSAITNGYEYDAAGNVVKATDANGYAAFSYFDKLGRKTAALDAEGYLTTWTYDAEGNVLTERRYATKFTGTPTTAAPPSVSTAGADRVTNFTYDRNGNRTKEERTGVEVHNGSGGYTTVVATIQYVYNGIGQVTRKTEATGDRVDYTYDLGGRLTEEERQAFVDHAGASVTPTVDYYYNGTGDLMRTRQRGSGDAAERVTTYGYDGGKLYWVRDAEVQDGDVKNGLLTSYWYDNAGRQTHQYYSRYDASGALTKSVVGTAATYEGMLTSYDAAGRVVQQWQATYEGSTWTDHGPRTVTTYNAFGEAVSVAVGGITQQQNQYDAAGRLTATSAGDGVWKHYGYDKNGNQTVAITSAGASLAGLTFAQALALVGQEDVNATYTVYDKRGLATSVAEEGRQLAVSGTAQTLTTSRSYNAFGDVASETNALGATIDYSYNTMGRLIKTESPTVSITLENGTTANVRPTEQYYYDKSGRLVATRDANNNLTRLTLLAGTGYNGAEALVTTRIAADGGTQQTHYDIHGDARISINELGYRTLQTFDGMGRLVIRKEERQRYVNDNEAQGVNVADDFFDFYSYDGLGQQLKHWNSQLGSGDAETTDYDTQGRVTSARAFGGDVTSVAYSWDATIAASGMGVTTGGWSKVTTMANGLATTEKTDLFGRVTWKQDLGGHVTSYGYDLAGRQTSVTMGGLTSSFTWLNSGFLGKMETASPNAGTANTNWTRDTATYSYDKVGNRLTETLQKERGIYIMGYSVTSEFVKNATATYDALGRLKTWAEAGSAKSPAASTANEYDANGNIRRTNSSYRALDATGAAATSPTTRDYWFRYDTMNRVVVDQGILQNGVIARGASFLEITPSTGRDIAYNVAGQRTSVTVTQGMPGIKGSSPSVWENRELYYYDAAGRLVETREVTGSQLAYSDIPPNPPPAPPPATGMGVKRSSYSYDLMGRQTSQQDFDTNGTVVVFSRNAVYNAKGQLTSEATSSLKSDNKTYTTSTTYNYGMGSAYMLGEIVSQSSSNAVTGQSTIWSSTTNSYVWYDGAQQLSISHKPNTAQPGTTWTTTFAYNDMGRLTSAYIADGKPHSVTFTNDELGQVIRREESNVSDQTGAPHEVWYRFAGAQLGYTGNNSTDNRAMWSTINDRTIPPPTIQGTFRGKQTFSFSYADFAQSYGPINSYNQGSATGSYEVQRGDTLQSIAHRNWGDASLWYKIAEANGMSAASTLVEGQRLTLPAGVMRNTHNASTFMPYDPDAARGDLTPNTGPAPAKNAAANKKKCGVFGAILLAAVAIVVTVATKGAGAKIAGALLGVGKGSAGAIVLGGALSAAAGSVVSQGVGVATGIQDKFSWKGVGLAALGGAIGGALGEGGAFGKNGLFGAVKSGAVQSALRGAAGSILAQGVGVATGLQSKFDFAGVAAAGVAGAIGYEAAKASGAQSLLQDSSPRNLAANMAVGAARLIANAATRSALTGNSFGDNVMRGLPDTLGQIAGEALAGLALPRNVIAASARANENPAAKADGDGMTTGQGTEIIVTANIRPGWAIDYFRLLNSAPGQQARAAAYEVIKREIEESGGSPSAGPTQGPAGGVAEGVGYLPGGRMSSAQSWADYLALTNSSADIDGFLESNAGLYGSMNGQGLGRAIFLSGNDGQVRRQILPLLNTLASDASNAGSFGQAFYQEAIAEISTMLAAVDARAAPALAQIEREGLAGLSLMFSPLIAMSAGSGGLLGWTGAGLQGNRTAQAVISAGAGRDTVSPLGHALPGGDGTVAGMEIATGGYALIRGGVGIYSSLRSVNAAESAPEFITVFRGDRAGTTVIKSHASREVGYAGSQRIIDSNGLDDLLSSHAADSLSPPSPFISVSTDPRVARYFAGPDGVVNEFRISTSRLIPNPHNNIMVPAGPGGRWIPESELVVPNYIRPSEFVRKR